MHDHINNKPISSSFSIAIKGEDYSIFWHEWGNASNTKILLCIHALNRNGRDFDALANAMCDDYRIICPDLPGRGQSDWLSNPKDYNHVTYMQVIDSLLDHLSLQESSLHFLGTSLGGILGMKFAAKKLNSIDSLIINDVGTEIPGRIFKAAADSIAHPMVFKTFDQAVLTFKIMTAPCGPLTDEQWRITSEFMVKKTDDGLLTLCYDPKIAIQLYEDAESNLNLWTEYEQIDAPMLIIHGEKSNVLTLDNVVEMMHRVPGTQVYSVMETGHFPMLMKQHEITAIKQFLLECHT